MKGRTLAPFALTGLLAGCTAEPDAVGQRAPMRVIEETLPVTQRPGPTGPERPRESSRWAKERDPYVNRFQAPDTEPDKPEKITVGMARDELVRILGRCASRPMYIPQSSSHRMVEVFQPDGEACVRRFGVRNYQVVHGSVTAIGDTLLPVHSYEGWDKREGI